MAAASALSSKTVVDTTALSSADPKSSTVPSASVFAVMIKKFPLRTLSAHGTDYLAVLRVSAIPETDAERAQLFDLASGLMREAAELSKAAKVPVMRMIWDFGNLPLDPRLNIPKEWTEDNKDFMRAGLVRSAVIVRDLVSKKLVQTWQGVMGGVADLPPSRIFRDNKSTTIKGITYSLGAWDAYNYAVRGERVGKFDQASLARVLSDAAIRKGYLAPWRAPLLG